MVKACMWAVREDSLEGIFTETLGVMDLQEGYSESVPDLCDKDWHNREKIQHEGTICSLFYVPEKQLRRRSR